MIKPLIVQSDGSLLLDLNTDEYKEARDALSSFAELEKSPEHIHTYHITSISLWNAASAGVTVEMVEETLKRYSRYPPAPNILVMVREVLSRYGKIKILAGDNPERLYLECADEAIHTEILSKKKLKKILINSEGGFFFNLLDRGTVKIELIRIGYPVVDLAPLYSGDPLSIRLNKDDGFALRSYQKSAVSTFLGGNKPGNGFGCVVMPCGSGKTIVGIGIMEALQMETLILAPNVASLKQWKNEILTKTTLSEEMVGEYSSEAKEVKGVTIATYQVLTWRPSKEDSYAHFEVFRSRKWGLIIYDEVHLLPAAVFRVTAEIQAVRRVGFTGTLVREDGEEEAVFSLVGPKRFDIPWKELENAGWIATAYCREIRVELSGKDKIEYAIAPKKKKNTLAAQNSRKLPIVHHLVEKHSDDQILLIGTYLDQLNSIARELDCPVLMGTTSNKKREKLYEAFRNKEIRILAVSKVANFAIDLPDASVAIQISGSFGSRQEEAQRLGRLLRPKDRPAIFYSLVSRYTDEEVFALNRQKFLVERGYSYNLEIWEDEDT